MLFTIIKVTIAAFVIASAYEKLTGPIGDKISNATPLEDRNLLLSFKELS